MNSKWLFSSGFFFEISSLLGFVFGTGTNEQFGYFLAMHCVGSALIALAVWLLLPSQYRFPAAFSYAFLYCITVFIPFIGAIGLVSCILPSLYFPQRRKAQILDIQEDIKLPYAQLEQQPSPLFNDGGLQDVLSLQENEDKRLNALLAVRNMSKKYSIPILKKALRDPSDDIRLLAYAMLDKYETLINTDLEGVLNKLNSAEGAHKAELHKNIARNYWELAYLGLAQGAVLDHALEQAQENIKQAVLFKETPELVLLTGRIALKQQRSEFATLAFQRAIEMGMDKQHVISYLAEAAYLSGRYHEIPGLLDQLPTALRNRYPFFELVDYWHVSANPS